MSAEEILRSNEASALTNNQIISRVSGKVPKKTSSKKAASFGAAGFITVMIVVFLVLFGSGNLIPSAISERLIEETDVQYADAVESKKLVFQQALINGNIPEDTAAILKNNGVLVGYEADGQFVESNQSSVPLSLKMGAKIISANDFIAEVSSDAQLYNAFNNATYSRAAYYYDEAAQGVFRQIGTTRNNYTESSDFDKVMSSLVGEGSDIDINSVSLIQKTRKNEQTGRDEIYYEYEQSGSNAKSDNSSAAAFVESVRMKNPAATEKDSALATAESLTVADTISKERRSSLFYLAFMENISKMKAGDGSASKINEAMNFLYDDVATEVVDVNTGEVKVVSGTAIESPSLYAILSGSKVEVRDVENYSTERILKTVKNQVGEGDSTSAIAGTVSSTSTKNRGTIGRFISNGLSVASQALMQLVTPTVSSSLINNSYETIKGVDAGEFLVEGAVNVGKSLAKASGATAGDSAAVTQYARLNNTVLAMDAAADRLNRSPFDITSKNTFLGSIVHKFAIFSTKFSGLKSFSKMVSSSALALMPASYAEDTDGYLSSFGDCETYALIGAVGSAQCAEIATFDTSTLNDIFRDPDFILFVEANTTINSSGARTITANSDLAKFILYNNERRTPLGIVDGGILNSLSGGSSSVPFVTNILEMVKNLIGASENNKRVASGAIYVNSSANPDWQTYKYAQRYVSLARATASLRQYTSDKTAYTEIKYFEGSENPVIAFLNEYNKVAAGN